MLSDCTSTGGGGLSDSSLSITFYIQEHANYLCGYKRDEGRVIRTCAVSGRP